MVNYEFITLVVTGSFQVIAGIMYIMCYTQQRMAGVTQEEIKEARQLAVWATLIIFLATLSQSIVGIIGYSKDQTKLVCNSASECWINKPNVVVFILHTITLPLILPHFYYTWVYKRWSEQPNNQGMGGGNNRGLGYGLLSGRRNNNYYEAL